MHQRNNGKREPETGNGLFAKTEWSQVQRAQKESAAALNSLCTKYREPLLVCLRGRLRDPQEAEDLVQGFFATMLDREFLARVRPEKGRFRSFLLTALENYLKDHWASVGTIKRGGGASLASLDEVDEEGNLVYEPPGGEPHPDEEVDRVWAQTVLRNALARLEQECERLGHPELFDPLEPILFDDDDSPSYAQVGRELGMKEGSVRVAAHRMRKRLQGLIREEVRETVSAAEDLEEELGYLHSLLARPANTV